AILRRDPADRDAGNLDHRLPPGEQFEIGPMLARLGFAREEAAEGDVVRPRLARFQRQMLRSMTGDADLRLPPQRLARFLRRAVGLSEVDAVRSETLGQRDRIVDDEGAVARRADFLQRGGELGFVVLVEALHPELERSDLPRIERARQTVREAAADVERRDEVEVRGVRRIGHCAVGSAAEGIRHALVTRSGPGKRPCAFIAPMNRALALVSLAPLSLAACMVVPDAPNVERTPMPAGYAVPIGQPV